MSTRTAVFYTGWKSEPGRSESDDSDALPPTRMNREYRDRDTRPQFINDVAAPEAEYEFHPMKDLQDSSLFDTISAEQTRRKVNQSIKGHQGSVPGLDYSPRLVDDLFSLHPATDVPA